MSDEKVTLVALSLDAVREWVWKDQIYCRGEECDQHQSEYDDGVEKFSCLAVLPGECPGVRDMLTAMSEQYELTYQCTSETSGGDMD